VADTTVTILITALDEASKVIDGIGKSGDDLAARFLATGQALEGIGDTLDKGVTRPIVSGLGASKKAAIDFESQLSGVRKTANLTAKETQMIGREVKQLSRQIPLTTEELNSIAKAAGQSGVPLQQMPKYIKDIAVASEALEVDANRAGIAFGKLSSTFNIPLNDIPKLAAAINTLGDTTIASEKEIIEATLRTSSLGQQAGLTAKETAALNATMISLGQTPYIAATAVNALLGKMTTAEVQSGRFQKGLKLIGISAADMQRIVADQGVGSITKLAEALDRLNPTERAKAIGLLFGGEYADNLGILMNRIDLFQKNLKEVGSDTKNISRYQEVYNTKLNTTEAQLQILKNAYSELAIEVGTALLPAVKQLAKALIPVVNGISDFVAKHPMITRMIASFAALAAAIAPVVIAVSRLVQLLGLLKLGVPIAAALANKFLGAKNPISRLLNYLNSFNKGLNLMGDQEIKMPKMPKIKDCIPICICPKLCPETFTKLKQAISQLKKLLEEICLPVCICPEICDETPKKKQPKAIGRQTGRGSYIDVDYEVVKDEKMAGAAERPALPPAAALKKNTAALAAAGATAAAAAPKLAAANQAITATKPAAVAATPQLNKAAVATTAAGVAAAATAPKLAQTTQAIAAAKPAAVAAVPQLAKTAAATTLAGTAAATSAPKVTAATQAIAATKPATAIATPQLAKNAIATTAVGDAAATTAPKVNKVAATARTAAKVGAVGAAGLLASKAIGAARAAPVAAKAAPAIAKTATAAGASATKALAKMPTPLAAPTKLTTAATAAAKAVDTASKAASTAATTAKTTNAIVPFARAAKTATAAPAVAKAATTAATTAKATSQIVPFTRTAKAATTAATTAKAANNIVPFAKAASAARAVNKATAFTKFTPAGLAKSVALDAVASGLEKLATSPGKAISSGLAKGISATASAPVKAVSKMAGAVRDRLPGSDARIGPLSDLSSTGEGLTQGFLDGIDSGLLSDRMESALNPPSRLPSPSVMSGTSSNNNYSPTYNISGLEKQDIIDELDKHDREFLDWFKKTQERLTRGYF
jgi:TP901 family phage tail tape measure protein